MHEAQPSPARWAQPLRWEGARTGLGLLPGSCRYHRSNGITGCASPQWRGEQGNTAAHRTVWQPLLLFQETDLQLLAPLFAQAGSSRHG